MPESTRSPGRREAALDLAVSINSPCTRRRPPRPCRSRLGQPQHGLHSPFSTSSQSDRRASGPAALPSAWSLGSSASAVSTISHAPPGGNFVAGGAASPFSSGMGGLPAPTTARGTGWPPGTAPIGVGGVPLASVGWNEALTHDVEIDPELPPELPEGGDDGLAVARIGMGAALALVRGSSSTSSLSEDESHASSHSFCRMLLVDRLPRAEFGRAPSGGRTEVPERPDDVRNKEEGTAIYACAEWGRAGGAVGWFIV